jgi:hypothetical protein
MCIKIALGQGSRLERRIGRASRKKGMVTAERFPGVAGAVALVAKDLGPAAIVRLRDRRWQMWRLGEAVWTERFRHGKVD